jgi:deoxyhypusine synthase
LITAYALNQGQPRSLKRLYNRREELLKTLQKDYLAAKQRVLVQA